MSETIYAKDPYHAGKKMKGHLLEKYAKKLPNCFFQYDANYSPSYDDCFPPDENGDVLSGATTTELMDGADVRVFVRPEVSKETAVRLLHKIIDWVERGGIDIRLIENNEGYGIEEDIPF